MVIPIIIPSETAKNLEPGITRARQKLIQNGAQLEINPAENGWELNIRKKVANTTSPLTLVSNTLDIINSGCASHFLGPTTPCTNKSSTNNGIMVGLPNGSSIRASHTALLPFPQLPLGPRQSNIFPALGNRNLISIGQLCNHGSSALFTAKDVSLIGPTTTLKVTRNTDNGL